MPHFHLALLAAIVLGFFHILLAAHSSFFQRGYSWAASERDDPVSPLSGRAGRLNRASANFFETFPLFVAAIMLAHITEVRSSAWGTAGAWMYVVGRALYLPAYAFGATYVRSLIWNIATIGIFLIIYAAALAGRT